MKLIGVKELAEIMGCHERTIRRYVKNPDMNIPHYVIRGRYRFDQERVIRRLETVTKEQSI